MNIRKKIVWNYCSGGVTAHTGTILTFQHCDPTFRLVDRIFGHCSSLVAVQCALMFASWAPVPGTIFRHLHLSVFAIHNGR